MPRIKPPEYVNGNAGKPDRIRIRQQLRIIIADVLLETGLSLQRFSRRIRPPLEWRGLDDLIKPGFVYNVADYEGQLRQLSEHDFKTLYQNEWRGSEDE